MSAILPDDGPPVDLGNGPADDWDYESAVEVGWLWTWEGLEAFKLAAGWGPR